MKRIISVLEAIQSLSQIALVYMQYICEPRNHCSLEQNKSQTVILTFILTLTIIKTKVEGNRWLFIFWFPSFALSVYHKIFHTYTSIEVVYLSAIISFLHLLLLMFFPSYEIPSVIQQSDASKSSPKYNVSCSSFPLDQEKSSMVTAYYPTDAESCKSLGDLCMLEADFWDYHFSKINQEFKIPTSLLHFLASGIQKYKVKVEERQPIIKVKNLKPIIFSHGFMGSRTMYSIICKQLASIGYVVFCVEHYDIAREKEVNKIKDKVQKKDLFKEVKEEELELRTTKIKAIIDLILRPNELSNLFGQNISIDVDSIILMGHSYGGATVQCSAFKYKEHLKAVICLDPWLFPMKDTYLEQNLAIPALYINSETFQGTMQWAELEKRNKLVFENSHTKNKSFNCYIKNMDHVQQGDIGLALPYELNLVNLIKYPQRTLEFNLYNAKLIELFLNNIVFSNAKDDQIIEYNKYINEKIFFPLKRDSFQFYRQELVHNYDEKREMYCLDFKGKSPF